MKIKGKFMATLAAAGVSLAAAVAPAQVQKDDLVIGANSSYADTTFRQVRSGSEVPNAWASQNYLQSVQFDNSSSISHNAQGNMLATNFGNSYTGFEVWNCSTDGSGNMEKVWSIKSLTGGSRTDRGGGLSVSPDNSKVVWANYDGGSVFVVDYNAGSAVGTGAGASIDGERETGTVSSLTAMKTGSSQGTTWLDNDTVLAFSAFGELIEVDASIAGGTADAPAEMSWSVAKSGVWYEGASAPGNAQYTDILYNEQIAPGYIFGAAGFYIGGQNSTIIYAWDLNYNLVGYVNFTDFSSREIAFDSEGNLYVGGWGHNICYKIDGVASNPAGLSGLTKSLYFDNGWYSSYSGLDVASSMPMNPVVNVPGDANHDNKVDVGDLGILAANYGGTDKNWEQGDFNNDGKVDVGDLGILAANYGTGTSGANWDADYAKAFGTTTNDDSSICSGLGLPLIAGLALMGLMLVKMDD